MSGMEAPEDQQLKRTSYFNSFEVDGIVYNYGDSTGRSIFRRPIISIHCDYQANSLEIRGYKYNPQHVSCETCWMTWQTVHDEKECTDRDNDCCGTWLPDQFLDQAWYTAAVRAQHERILKWTLDLPQAAR